MDELSSFFKSDLIKNLEAGEAPDIPITFTTDGIIYMCIGLLIVAIIVILMTYLFFKTK